MLTLCPTPAHLRQYAAVRAQSDTKPLKSVSRSLYAGLCGQC